MKNHALLSYCYACILGIFIFPTMAQAQDAPNSSWTVSAETGFSVIIDCNECHPSNIFDFPLKPGDAMSYQLIGTQISRRYTRWVGITGHIGLGKLNEQSTKVLGSNGFPDVIGYPMQRNLAVNSWMFTIGPQFFLRIGQGDLGFEMRTGIAIKTARVQATGFQGENLDIRYKPAFSRTNALRLNYTFWPQARFGVRIALGITDTRIGFPNNFQPQTPIDLGSQIENPEILERLHPQSDGAASVDLLLGVTYRL